MLGWISSVATFLPEAIWPRSITMSMPMARRLGWLNAAVHLRAVQTCDWRRFVLDLMRSMQDELRPLDAEIAHLKLRLTAGQGSLTASLTGSEAMPAPARHDRRNTRRGVVAAERPGELYAGPVAGRVRSLPARRCRQQRGRVVIDDVRSFAPGRPQPTYRL